MSDKCPYIETHVEHWGPEFADYIGVKHRPEHDQFVSHACYTMLYEIASNFRNGEFYDEILSMWDKDWGDLYRREQRKKGKK